MGTRDELLAQLLKNADSRGRVSVSTDRLQTLMGLDSHDTHKRLYELADEGSVSLKTRQVGGSTRIVSIRVRKGHLNDEALRQRAESTVPSHTVPERAWAWLEAQPTREGGWIDVTVASLSAALGIDPRADNRVGIAVSGWARQGRIALKKGNARIEAIRLNPNASPYAGKPAPSPQTASEAPPVESVGKPIEEPAASVSIPLTPALDQYVAARRIARLAPEDNPFIRVEFEPNAIAEEAVALKTALRAALGTEGDTNGD